MTIQLVIAWPCLASSNERHKAGGGRARAHSKRYRESRDAIYVSGMVQLRNSGVVLPAFPAGPVAVSMRFFPPDRRRRDESNFLKVLLDGLNGVAWKDDSQVFMWQGTREVTDPKRPRVEIELTAPTRDVSRSLDLIGETR